MAEKKGDILDGMFFYGKEDADPIQFLDYPETEVETLRLFYNTWKIPSYVIPSKKSKYKFEEWVLQLQDLNNICPSTAKMKLAMEIRLQNYEKLPNKFSIVRPASIRSLLINATAEINRKTVATKEAEKVVVTNVASVQQRKSAARELKSFLKDG